MDLFRIARTGLWVAGKAADLGLSVMIGVVRRVRGDGSSAVAAPQPASREDRAPAPAPAAEQPRSARFSREISNPKRARAVRGRGTASSTEDAHVSGASGRGGSTASVPAENHPSELAARRTGRTAAPLGSEDEESESS